MEHYPILAGEIARRGITKKELAESIGVCPRALYNKMRGKVPFTWPEAKTIWHQFFPDMDPDDLFAEANEESA